jgi:uncharacterized Zn-binding protein involved in type VI secretion
MGFPAARITDMHVCPMVTGIVPHVGGPIITGMFTVITGNMPQARVTDMCICVGPPDMIIKGSMTVLVGGLQAARILDTTVHGGVIVTGWPTVLIGDEPPGGGGGGSGVPGGQGSAVNWSGGGPGGQGGGDEGAAAAAASAATSAPGISRPAEQAQALIEAAKFGSMGVRRCVPDT